MKALSHTLLFFLLLASGLPLRAASVPDAGRKADGSRNDTSRNDTSRNSTASTAARPDYILQPLDVLKVMVFQEDEINKQGEVRISEQATITLPLIGSVSVKGKTVRQAETFIHDLYDKDYLVNPQVNVQVLKYA